MTVFSRRSELDGAVEELTARGLQVVVLDAGSWSTGPEVHRDIAVALDFPAYYGRNLDALSDCLSDVVAREYGLQPSAAGLALVFLGFDRFAAALPDLAPAFVNILVTQARGAAETGATMALLLQSDDRELDSDSMGAPGAVGL
ncbi:barstar family protein [Cellulosimicrobium cellulans]|uniref:barstar family protein n=1 Tax=Cellulosimicrobium cellulans TaxID=1710 RepID=UPI002405F9B4|nr:barstar family protein [Cellulosimicrobium cellulans]MDF9878443.1 RNAse (barnase) inhibitor barstar [Cellulosimicrobium cellulans]